MSKNDILNMKNGTVVVLGDDHSVQIKKIEDGTVSDVDFQDFLMDELLDTQMKALLYGFTLKLLLESY